jgi:hypothetical protein
MSLPALLQLDRPHRISLDRTATLRDTSQKPIDVRVHNVSSTGCLVSTDETLPDDTLVTIGIAGLGTRPARIARQTDTLYGLEFLEPASEAELLPARHAETLVDGVFATPLPTVAPAPVVDERYSLRTRFLIIAGTSFALWGVMGAGVATLVLR